MDYTISGDDSNLKNDAKMRSYGSVSEEDADVLNSGGLDDDADEEVESKPLLDIRSHRRSLFTSVGVIFGAIVLVSVVVVVGRQRAHSTFGLSPSTLRSATRPEALPLEGYQRLCNARLSLATCKETDCADPSKLNADCSACLCGYDNNPNNPNLWCDGNVGCLARLKEFQRTIHGLNFECESGLIVRDGWCVRPDMKFCDPKKFDTWDDEDDCTNKCANPQYVDRCKSCMCGYNNDGGAWCDGNKGTPGDVNSGCTEAKKSGEEAEYGFPWECESGVLHDDEYGESSKYRCMFGCRCK